ncbi:MAG: DUF423 domain-containing protein [Acidobacteria bacterium]|nr:DUF423 domain-containing protein [Acidobacteriota bacterium]
MDRARFVRLGAWAMAFGVALGAFGAHGLKTRVSPEMLAIYETGVRYHLVHALGLFVVAWLCGESASRAPRIAGILLVAGILLFSGSLYLLALTGIRPLGAITPLGGVAWLAAWVTIAAGTRLRA